MPAGNPYGYNVPGDPSSGVKEDERDTGAFSNLRDLVARFTAQDAARRSGTAGDSVGAALEDRKNEGALMAGLGAPPVVVGAVGLANEGVKALGQRFPIIGENLPGPFKVDETTSPASLDNVAALVRGAVDEKAASQERRQNKLKEIIAGAFR